MKSINYPNAHSPRSVTQSFANQDKIVTLWMHFLVMEFPSFVSLHLYSMNAFHSINGFWMLDSIERVLLCKLIWNPWTDNPRSPASSRAFCDSSPKVFMSKHPLLILLPKKTRFWGFLTSGKLAQAILAPCISDLWSSISLNRWKHNCINTDKRVFLNCPLWGNAVLKAWFTDLFNTCLLSVDYVWDTFAGIKATGVNEIVKSSFVGLIS